MRIFGSAMTIVDPPSPAARVRAAGSLASQRVAAVSGLSLSLSPAVSLVYRSLSKAVEA
jgi:hypothetical protein